MAVSNIEKFDDYAGRIFAELYQRFPMPYTLSPGDFMEVTHHTHENGGGTFLSEDAKFFVATSNWLISAGYVSATKQLTTGTREAVLTSKGLEILKATPHSVSQKSSLGEALISSVAEGGKDVTKGLVAQAFSLGARFISPIVGPIIGLS